MCEGVIQFIRSKNQSLHSGPKTLCDLPPTPFPLCSHGLLLFLLKPRCLTPNLFKSLLKGYFSMRAKAFQPPTFLRPLRVSSFFFFFPILLFSSYILIYLFIMLTVYFLSSENVSFTK